MYMDDFTVFENFLSTQCRLTVINTKDETVGFVNSFTALFATSDVEIDDFLKRMHAMNPDSPANGKIFIIVSTIIALKSLRI